MYYLSFRTRATRPTLTRWSRPSEAAKRARRWACSAKTNSQESTWRAGMTRFLLRDWRRWGAIPTHRPGLWMLRSRFSRDQLYSASALRWTSVLWSPTRWRWRKTESWPWWRRQQPSPARFTQSFSRSAWWRSLMLMRWGGRSSWTLCHFVFSSCVLLSAFSAQNSLKDTIYPCHIIVFASLFGHQYSGRLSRSSVAQFVIMHKHSQISFGNSVLEGVTNTGAASTRLYLYLLLISNRKCVTASWRSQWRRPSRRRSTWAVRIRPLWRCVILPSSRAAGTTVSSSAWSGVCRPSLT